MQYRIRHTTRQSYDQPVRENVMEVRLRPRSDAGQRCHSFSLSVLPRANTYDYRDYLDNHVHTFDLPARHRELVIVAESVVQVLPPTWPTADSFSQDWGEVDACAVNPEFWEMINPTQRTGDTALLRALAAEIAVDRTQGPLGAVEALNQGLHQALTYDRDATHVHSRIDESLASRSGVCQDFTHIMLALVRNYLRIPCRYVSGYLFHSNDDTSADGESHAWLEVYLPAHGWVGFDPTNNLRAGQRHIRVAYGRDYDDVAPTRGVFQGEARSDLTVAVSIQKLEQTIPDDEDESWLLAQRPPTPAEAEVTSSEQLVSQQQQQ